MRRRTWTTALLALLLAATPTGCGGAPGSDVPDSTLVAALTDLHLLDARRETFGDAGVPVDSLRAAMLAAHDLDAPAFDAALDALAADPERMRTVYDSVIVRINAESADLRQRR